MPNIIRNSAKPIKGLVTAVVTYLILKAGLEVDADAAAGTSAVVYAAVVRFVYPIFGLKRPTPEV